MACTAHSNTTTCTGHTNLPSCSGHAATIACTAHSVTTSCPGHVGGSDVCPTHTGRIDPVTPTVWTDPGLTTQFQIKAVHINELRTAILNEAGRRGEPGVPPPAVSAGGVINNETILELRSAIATLSPGWAYPGDLANSVLEDGDQIRDEPIVALRDRMNFLESECVCNCNYGCSCQCDYTCTCKCNYACTCQCNYACTCQCNYACTCNCNYPCTCDCNYCTCDCDYNCTCDCNYSDENLKLEVEYL